MVLYLSLISKAKDTNRAIAFEELTHIRKRTTVEAKGINIRNGRLEKCVITYRAKSRDRFSDWHKP